MMIAPTIVARRVLCVICGGGKVGETFWLTFATAVIASSIVVVVKRLRGLRARIAVVVVAVTLVRIGVVASWSVMMMKGGG